MELQRASTATWSGPAGRTRARSRVTPRTVERLGVYQVKGLLGVGGMARVYLGENTLVERPVAIKRLLPELAAHPEAHAMFLREARINGAIRHPNLLEIYDFGYDADGRPYFVMELARGDTLAERLEAGPLLVSRALDYAIAITWAVAAVHEAGYLHRDLKADNVMLAVSDDRRLTPKLIDFGIACRMDEAGPVEIVGTPRMMAPEQVARDRVDQRTDIWGIGVMLYEMLAGRLPFDPGATVRDDLLAIVTEVPHPLPRGVHPEVCSIVEACLSKDPDDRPRSAAVLAEELLEAQDRYLASRGMIARARR
jgi:serine/threonine protein kinase